jgi:parvulin-like peptidyl-prolyl isomerase
MKLLCTIAAGGLLAGLGFQVRAELVDGVNAIVHDAVITYQQVGEATAPLLNRLHDDYRSQPELFQKRLNEALEDNLQRLVENQLILHEFQTGEYNHGLIEAIVDEQLRENIRTAYGNDRVRFIKTLQAEGRTYEQFRREFRERIIIQQMRWLRGGGEIIVSPHKIEVYYVNHQEQFKVPAQVRLRMIMLVKPEGDQGQTRSRADEILGQIKGGASFAEMASVYSVDTRRYPGGDWGWWEAGKLVKELAEQAAALKPGENSEVIETPDACYLMRVDDKRPEHVRPLKEVRDDIERTLLGQESDRLQKRWIERLKKKTFVRYFPTFF